MSGYVAVIIALAFKYVFGWHSGRMAKAGPIEIAWSDFFRTLG